MLKQAKKIVSVILVLCMFLTNAVIVYADNAVTLSETENDYLIIDAPTLSSVATHSTTYEKSEVFNSETGELLVNFKTLDGATTNNYMQFDFSSSSLTAGYTVKEYPIIKISYKTDIKDTKAWVDTHYGLDYNGTSTCLWGYNLYYNRDSQMHTCVYDVSSTYTYGQNIDKTDYSYDNIDDDSVCNYFTMKPYAYAASANAGENFAVEYIGFFKTVEDANAHTYEPDFSVKELAFSAESYNLEIGESIDAEVIATPSYADTSKLTYVSSDPKVATVDKDGIITALTEGSTTVTVTDTATGVSGTVNVSVGDKHIVFDADTLYDSVLDDIYHISGKLTKSYETDSESGRTYVKFAATAEATAGQYFKFDFENAGLTDGYTVKEYPVMKIGYKSSISDTAARVDTNYGVTYKADDGTADQMLWAYSWDYTRAGVTDAKIIDVRTNFTTGNVSTFTYDSLPADSICRYLTLKPFTSSATVTEGEYFAVEYIGFFKTAEDAENYTFDPMSIREITPAFDTCSLTVGSEKQISYTYAPTNAKADGITYYSSDEAVATVDDNGVIKAVGLGSAVIVVKDTYSGEAASIEVNVDEYLFFDANTLYDTVLDDIYHISSKLTKSYENDSESGRTYVKFTAAAEATAGQYFKFDFENDGLTDGYSVKDYPVMKIGYKSSISDTAAQVDTCYGVTYKADDSTADQMLWAYWWDYTRGEADATTIIDVRTDFPTGNVGTFTYDSLPADSVCRYLTLKPFTYSTTVTEGEYFAVEYIAFFESVDAAENYAYDPFAIKTLDTTFDDCNLAIGETKQIGFTYTPDTADLTGITYTSSDEDVATVDNNGVITAKAHGTATITVKDASTGVYCTVDVLVDNKYLILGAEALLNSASTRFDIEKGYEFDKASNKLFAKFAATSETIYDSWLKFNFAEHSLTDGFTVKKYPVVKIVYKSDISDTTVRNDVMYGLDYLGTSTCLWYYTFDYARDESVNTHIFDVSSVFRCGLNISTTEYSFDNIDDDSVCNYLTLKPFYNVYSTPVINDGEYFAIEYIGFFKNEEDANAYVYTAKELPELEVSVDVIGNGSFSVDGAESTTTYSEQITVGSDMTLSATADEGHRFVGWYSGENLVSESAEYTFTVEADTVLTAKFEENVIYHSITVNAIGNGSFSVDGGEAVKTYTADIAEGEKITLTAIADTTYVVDGWYEVTDSKNIVLAKGENTYELTVSDDAVIEVRFMSETIKVATKLSVSVGAGEGTIEVGGNAYEDYTDYANGGDTVEVTAKPNDGYAVAYWTRVSGGVETYIGTNETISVSPLGTSVIYKPVFIEAGTTVNLYVDAKGVIIATGEEPAVPDRIGYTGGKWLIDEESTSVKVYVADYVKSDETYTLTVNYLDGTSEEKSFKYNQLITLTATAEDTQWVLNSTVVSNASEYSFYATFVEDITITETESDEKAVILAVTDTIYDAGSKKIKFMVSFELVEGMEFVETGVLLSNNADIADTMEIGDEGVITGKSSAANASAGNYIINKGGVSVGDTWYGRAYLICKQDGETTVLYADTVSHTAE